MAVIYRLLADGVVLLHLAFVVFALLGGLWVLRRPRLAWVHVPAALWAAGIELLGWICPLTPLENWLRVQGGQQGYGGGFVEHYILPILYPAELTREIQWLLAAVVILVNGLIYWRVVSRMRRRKE